MSTNPIAVSFVHGYENLDINLVEQERPGLWIVGEEDQSFYSYPFPRNPEDFEPLKDLIKGEMPFSTAATFKKLPRFGLTGLAQTKDFIMAGTWNSVYKIRKSDYQLESIITNHLMSDMHGIYADEDVVITILTCKDTVVISDHDGNVKDHFAVEMDLKVLKYHNIDDTDWRFISKMFRGSTGFWHFNYVQKIGNEIWLTARNANCFVVVDLETKKATLRLMNLCTPALIHDGVKKGEKHYFTSIDGKILITEYHDKTRAVTQERVENLDLYNRDLVTTVIRLEETELGREPNWCRGIDAENDEIFVSIDGRYDTDLSFGLLCIEESTSKIKYNKRLHWSEIGNEEEIRFVTGFDTLVLH